MTKRQKKKLYQKTHGYNPNEEEKIQQLIYGTIKHTDQRLAEDNRAGIYRMYAGFLKSIKQRSKSKNRWRRNK